MIINITKNSQFNDDEKILKIAERLCKARRILVFTGAGMSAESGINTFRDPEMGVWKNKLALYLFGTPFGWKFFGNFAWKKYLIFRKPIAIAIPHPGHLALAWIEKLLKQNGAQWLIATQNVDNLHQSAGCAEDTVVEVHGSVFKHRCTKRSHPVFVKDTVRPSQTSSSSSSSSSSLSLSSSSSSTTSIDYFADDCTKAPICSVQGCKSLVRPDVVLFGEALPEALLNRAFGFAKSMTANDVCIMIGCSGAVYPSASIPILAHRNGAFIIEMNLGPSELTSIADAFFYGPCGKALPILLQGIEKILGVDREKEGHAVGAMGEKGIQEGEEGVVGGELEKGMGEGEGEKKEREREKEEGRVEKKQVKMMKEENEELVGDGDEKDGKDEKGKQIEIEKEKI